MTSSGSQRRRPWWWLPLLEVVLLVVLGAVTNVVTGLLPDGWKWTHDLWWMGATFAVVAVLTIVITMARQRRDRLATSEEPVPPAPAVTSRSVTAHTIHGPVVTGDGATIVQHAAPPVPVAPAAVPAPDGLVNVADPAGVFIGRRGQLAQLDDVLTEPGTVVVHAVHGLGGVGKSTLAARWAWQHRDRYRPVWLIDADTTASIDTGLAALAVALQPNLAADVSLQSLRERALQWLASHDRWLLILDNVNDPQDVARLLGRIGTGRVLVTSRRATGWAGIAAPITVDVLDLDEAVSVMRTVLTHDGRPCDVDGLEQVCQQLGCLPLAVRQAAAYLSETGLSAHRYLDMLKAYPAAVFEHGGEDAGHRTIARIWRVTLDRLTDTPLAATILRTLAWYAPDAIPRSLLDDLADPPALARAVGRLTAYSMITTDGQTISVHRLVQAVSRTPDPEDPHRRAADIHTARTHAIAALRAAMPDDYRQPAQWPRWRILAPHVEALAQHSTTHPDDDTTASLLYNQIAAFLHDQGAVSRAIPLFEQALTDYRGVLGDDHPDTLTSVNNLAGAYETAGDLTRAIPLFEQALTDYRGVLGNDHPQTLTSVNNLAYAYETAGDLTRAIPLHEQGLTDRRRVLGNDHPQTLTSVNNLAGAYETAGDLTQAIPLYEQGLTGRRRVLGDDHPQTLTSVNNLAYAYQAAGDLTRAIPLHEQGLTDRRRVLGNDHPQTLTSVNNLAGAYQAAGDLTRAIPLHEQGLTDRRRVLGNDHPQTLTSVNNLAYAYETAGDLTRAIPLYEQGLTDRRRVLGNDHPDTLTSVNNLAGAYETAGDLTRAIPLYEQGLTDRRRVLGDDHPQTLTSVNNLAYAYQAAGDLTRAIPLYEQALTDCRRVLGNDHPQTKIIAANRAAVSKQR